MPALSQSLSVSLSLAAALVGCVADADAPPHDAVAADPATLDRDRAPTGPGARTLAGPPGSAHRVVSLHPAASALLVALGAADVVVGRAIDDRTPALAGRPVVGSVLRASPERVRALEPDLVLVPPAAPQAHLALLLEGSVRVLPVRLERLDDVASEARLLGGWVERSGTADRFAVDLTRRLEELRRRPPRCARTVLWAVGAEPPVVAGPGTLPDDLLDLVGARNALADARVPWPRPALEVLVDRAGDVLVWPVGGDLPLLADLPEASPWRRLYATGRVEVVELDSELVHEAGPRVALAAARLAAALAETCPGDAGDAGDADDAGAADDAGDAGDTRGAGHTERVPIHPDRLRGRHPTRYPSSGPP